LRHGHAHELDNTCSEDFERALTRRGTIEAQEMGALIVRKNLVPDLMLVSPAERAWTTAEIIAAACELDDKQVLGARELYLATAETTWRVLRQHAKSHLHVMICGHNPGLSNLAGRLGPRPQPRELPTAGLVTAVWHHADWATLEPEGAGSVELDDPEEAQGL
jgi:phosphohistidine phosphatase